MSHFALGDCFDFLKTIPDKSVDLITVDPPWLKTECEFDKQDFDFAGLFTELRRVLKDTGWFFLFAPVELACHAFATGWKLKFHYVWVKPIPVPKTPNTVRPFSIHELVFAFVKDDLKKPTELTFNKDALRTYGKAYSKKLLSKWSQTQFSTANKLGHRGDTAYIHENDGYREGFSVVYFNSKSCMTEDERTEHPTQKPEGLLYMIVKGYSNPGDVVLDCCAGSGTSLVAAKANGRQYLGCEIDPEFYQIAKTRLEALDSNIVAILNDDMDDEVFSPAVSAAISSKEVDDEESPCILDTLGAADDASSAPGGGECHCSTSSGSGGPGCSCPTCTCGSSGKPPGSCSE